MLKGLETWGRKARQFFFVPQRISMPLIFRIKKGELTHTYTYAVYTFVYVIATGISFKFNDTHTQAYQYTVCVCVYINSYTITPRRRKWTIAAINSYLFIFVRQIRPQHNSPRIQLNSTGPSPSPSSCPRLGSPLRSEYELKSSCPLFPPYRILYPSPIMTESGNANRRAIKQK